jgi:hypothetical protein
MKLYSPSGASLHRLCCSDLPTGIGSHCGPVAGESEPRAAVAKVHSEDDQRKFIGMGIKSPLIMFVQLAL